jgi:hypothetical protein
MPSEFSIAKGSSKKKKNCTSTKGRSILQTVHPVYQERIDEAFDQSVDWRVPRVPINFGERAVWRVDI